MVMNPMQANGLLVVVLLLGLLLIPARTVLAECNLSNPATSSCLALINRSKTDLTLMIDGSSGCHTTPGTTCYAPTSSGHHAVWFQFPDGRRAPVPPIETDTLPAADWEKSGSTPYPGCPSKKIAQDCWVVTP